MSSCMLLDVVGCCSPGKVGLDSALHPGSRPPELRWVALFLDSLLRVAETFWLNKRVKVAIRAGSTGEELNAE